MENTKEFSLIKAIRSQLNGNSQTGIEAKVIEAGAAELRKSNLVLSGTIQIPTETRAVLSATVAGSGKEIVSSDKLGILAPLRANLVLAQAGARILTGLVGNTSLPVYSGSSAKWRADGETAEDGAGTFGEAPLKPKRLTTFITVQRSFLLQDSTEAEAMLMDDLIQAIGDKLEATILGAEAGTDDQPAGFFETLPSGTFAGAVDYPTVVAMETEADASNAVKNGVYITNGKGRAILRKTAKNPNTGEYLMEKSEMLGYPVLTTNNVAGNLQVGADEQGVIFGDFSQLAVGFWGAIDLIVNPYTEAHLGNVIITVIAYCDAVTRVPGAFKTATIK